MSNQQLYKLIGVGKEFAGPAERVEVLSNVDLTVQYGESVAILGASGSGKSTLLHIMGTLDDPSRGTVQFAGQDVKTLGERRKARLRNKEIGFVFQFHYLLPEFNAMENVAMPGILAGMGRDEALGLAERALERVGLAHRKEHHVTTLSGGERQRAAIARALILSPRVVLADEPTGNLDEKTGTHVAELLQSLNQELGMTFVVVTHNHELADAMQRRLELRSGELYAQ